MKMRLPSLFISWCLFFTLLSIVQQWACASTSGWFGKAFSKGSKNERANDSANRSGSGNVDIIAKSPPFLGKRRITEETWDDDEEVRPILPKPVPHEDSCYLLEFHSDNCDFCDQMEPVLQRLEKDLDTKIRRINIMRRKEFGSLLEVVGFDECGTLPFYYNRRTGQAICGATSYLNLKRWGTGNLKHLFQDPPENLFEIDDNQVSRRGDVGIKGAFMEKVMNMEKRGTKGKAGSSTSTSKDTAASKKKGGDKGKVDSSGDKHKTASVRLQERRAKRQAEAEKKKN